MKGVGEGGVRSNPQQGGASLISGFLEFYFTWVDFYILRVSYSLGATGYIKESALQ